MKRQSYIILMLSVLVVVAIFLSSSLHLISPLGTSAVIKLRPNANGDIYGQSGYNFATKAPGWYYTEFYQYVGDNSAYLIAPTVTPAQEYIAQFQIADTTASGIISRVTVKGHFSTNSGGVVSFIIKSYGITKESQTYSPLAGPNHVGEETGYSGACGIAYEVSHTWDNNPVTGSQWLWSEIKNLQIGTLMKSTDNTNCQGLWCYQLWIEIEYLPTYTLTVNTNPTNALVQVGDTVKSSGIEGTATFTFEGIDTHTLTVSKKGHSTFTQNITINQDKQIDVQLKKMKYWLIINTIPLITNVTVDGQTAITEEIIIENESVGVAKFLLDFGQYNITVSKGGYPSLSDTILLEQNTSITFNLVTGDVERREIPGFEAITLFISLIVAIILLRRRKR
jgi:hypothetical protein